MRLLDMPDDSLRKVFGFLTFHEIALLRPVCRKFNAIATQLLRCEYCRLEQQVRNYRKDLKLLLPRRESERRKHTLAGHADVLSAVETRLSLLGMTIMRYVDEGLCSFFPGKVLDEVRRVYVTITSSTDAISRSTELLRELRDISSMAMEYFDEILLPRIYECKMQQQKQSPTELSYRRRSRQLQRASMLNNLNQSFSSLSGVDLVSSSSTPPSVDTHKYQLTQTVHDGSCRPASPKVDEASMSTQLASLTKQVNAMRQMVTALTATQRELAERNSRLNKVVISLGYRIHKLESNACTQNDTDVVELGGKRHQTASGEPAHGSGMFSASKVRRLSNTCGSEKDLPSPPSSPNA
ncbi:unnamed protein product [Mesocestoides corti]|uniref:F-box domain-containing protein n=1 Tax=Mesocestoides corti TaxID=53468 RepID=A0A0R3UHE5_MESCO|nr:unnamed protein product [Mesocestoides corti]